MKSPQLNQPKAGPTTNIINLLVSVLIFHIILFSYRPVTELEGTFMDIISMSIVHPLKLLQCTCSLNGQMSLSPNG